MTWEEALLTLARAVTVLLPILLSGLFFIACMKKRWLLVLNKPMDFGLKIGGKRLFGPNKNWRGAVIYLTGGTGITLVLHYLSLSQPWVAPVFAENPWLLGPLCCAGYILGELINSFIKRRLDIDPGTKAKSSAGRAIQAFFDNADGAIGYALVLNLLFLPQGAYLYVALVLALAVHAGSDVLMRKLSLKHKKN
ncbi:MAG: CDP-archaeol synthase [Acidobacteria bacterium]|nr:CDP-archaeol synthase [Acidobacteriota bacterium]